MFRTVFLDIDTESDESKTYKYQNLKNKADEAKSLLLTSLLPIKQLGGILARTHSFESGSVQLKTNETHWLCDYITEKTDLVLPANPKPQDWVCIMYENQQMLDKVSWQNTHNIKLYRNKSRIMGLDEDLTVDMPVAVLKLGYLDNVNGWIII